MRSLLLAGSILIASLTSFAQSPAGIVVSKDVIYGRVRGQRCSPI